MASMAFEQEKTDTTNTENFIKMYLSYTLFMRQLIKFICADNTSIYNCALKINLQLKIKCKLVS